MNNREPYDYVILGAGIVGLAIARELTLQDRNARILIVEKETGLGRHASGRNSGVLHSGIYYPQGSMKAQVCRSGAKAMAKYCVENRLPLQRIGKVIVPARESDDPQIDILHDRAQASGAHVELIDAEQLREVEPEARTASGRALYSPDTAVIDPVAILQHLAQRLADAGVDFDYDAPCTSANPEASTVTCGGKEIRYGHLYNATGAYADRIAKYFEVGTRYALLPFKGRYYALRPNAGIHINGLIYPVPNIEMPFLGVHSVKNVAGDIYFGPTATPALGRENYHRLQGMELAEAGRICSALIRQYYANHQGFRRLVREEARRLFPSEFASDVMALVPNATRDLLIPSKKVGIRPQLVDLEKRELVMDFVVENKGNSTHVLNAISPAFTSAFSFASLVVAGNDG